MVRAQQLRRPGSTRVRVGSLAAARAAGPGLCGMASGRSLARVVAALALALAALAPAAAAAESYTLRWLPPDADDGGPITGYRAYISTATMSRAEPIELGLVAPGADGIARARVDGI